MPMALAATGATFLALSTWYLLTKKDFSFMGGFCLWAWLSPFCGITPWSFKCQFWVYGGLAMV
jgi:FtsH-binding integral membrane protein